MKNFPAHAMALTLLALTISLPVASAQSNQSSGATETLSQKQQANALKWKERILKVPVGSFVKAKLENHQEWEGQLRDISDSSFSIQVLKDNQIETVAVRYEDMQSLNVAGHPSNGSKIAKSILMSGF